jgi:hypothetical protein
MKMPYLWVILVRAQKDTEWYFRSTCRSRREAREQVEWYKGAYPAPTSPITFRIEKYIPAKW